MVSRTLGPAVVLAGLLMVMGSLTASGAERPTPGLPAAKSALRGALQAVGLAEAAPIRTYLAKAMYQAINGEADLFLSYAGQGMVAARCRAGKGEVEAEVFDQAQPLNAFGVYSQAMGSGKPVAVGAGGGLVAEESVRFWKSRYFARVSSVGTDRVAPERLLALARAIAARLAGSSQLPAWIKVLPARPQAKPSRYVARNVLGHSFLTNAALRDYPGPGGTCTLALARAGGEAAARSLHQRLRETYHGRPPGPDWGKLARSQPFVGTDRGRQPVWAARQRQYLVVIVGRCQAGTPAALAGETLARLERLKAR